MEYSVRDICNKQYYCYGDLSFRLSEKDWIGSLSNSYLSIPGCKFSRGVNRNSYHCRIRARDNDEVFDRVVTL